MTKNEREIDVVFTTTTTTAPLYGFIETLITMSGVEISVEWESSHIKSFCFITFKMTIF